MMHQSKWKNNVNQAGWKYYRIVWMLHHCQGNKNYFCSCAKAQLENSLAVWLHIAVQCSQACVKFSTVKSLQKVEGQTFIHDLFIWTHCINQRQLFDISPVLGWDGWSLISGTWPRHCNRYLCSCLTSAQGSLMSTQQTDLLLFASGLKSNDPTQHVHSGVGIRCMLVT